MSEERKFLHDIASPMATITLLTEVLCEDPGVSPEVRKVNELALRVGRMIEQRRNVLIARDAADGEKPSS